MSWEKYVSNQGGRNLLEYIRVSEKRITFSAGFIDKAFLSKSRYVKLFFDKEHNKIGFLFSISRLVDAVKLTRKKESRCNTMVAAAEGFVNRYGITGTSMIDFKPQEETIEGLEGYFIQLPHPIVQHENRMDEVYEQIAKKDDAYVATDEGVSK